MNLLIDTTQKKCFVGFWDDKRLAKLEWPWSQDTGQEILNNIKHLLSKRQLKLDNIKAILVNLGPGSFTGTRVGVTVANTLGWTLNIPVIGRSVPKDSPISGDLIEHWLGQKNYRRFPAPLYQ